MKEFLKFNKWLLLVSIAIIIVAVSYAMLKSHGYLKPTNTNININTSNTVDNEEPPKKPEFRGSASRINQAETGKMLYVSGGDVWYSDHYSDESSIKLIDGDTVVGAEYSPDMSMIAYAKNKQVEYDYSYLDTSGWEDKTVIEREPFDQTELYLANRLGMNSVLVNDSIARWGWIPGTAKIWYETAVLHEVFGWEISGDGNIWVVDASGKNPEKILTSENSPWEILNTRWDPSGRYLAFFRNTKAYALTLNVYDRQTHQDRILINVPYIGGDRGGPPPVPTYFWSKDGKNIYTAFTPLATSVVGENATTEYEPGKIHILKVSTSTGAVTSLYSGSSCGENEEIYPPITFSDDFTQAIFMRAASDAPLNGDYVYCENIKSDLVKYDFTTKTETVLMSDPPFDRWCFKTLNSQLLFQKTGSVYYFTEDKTDMIAKRINLTDLTVNDAFLGKAGSGSAALTNISVRPDTGTYLFQYDNTLYALVPQSKSDFYRSYLVKLKDDVSTYQIIDDNK